MKVKIDHIPPLILQNNFHLGKEHKNESQSRESLGGVICALRRREGGCKGTLQGEGQWKGSAGQESGQFSSSVAPLTPSPCVIGKAMNTSLSRGQF